MTKKLGLGIVAVLVAGLFTLLALAADQPLTPDDITLLLLGGSSTQKIVTLVEQRGISFKMNPDLAKKIHDAGASDDLIEALTKAGLKAKDTPSSPTASVPAAAASSQQTQGANTPAPNSKSADVDRKVAETISSLSDKPTVQTTSAGAAQASAASAKPAPDKSLADPSPDQVQRIIQEFAAKEKLFKEARNNYTYHQINKVEELGPDNEVEGVFEQEWDILFDDAGNRIERVTYAPADTLKRIIMTKEDYVSMRNTQPFVLTSDELPEYEIKYLGHVKVDQITAYVFSIRPKEIQKGQQYFQGVVWVDDRDLQIVKSEGKPVPELHTRKGENLFPRFTTWREQIDGKYWFPTYTMADDTLYFSNGPVHIKQILRYTDYKQFKSKVRILSATPTDRPNAPAIPVTPNQ